MGCCSSHKEEFFRPSNELLLSESQINIQALDFLQDFLINNPYKYCPHIEALVVFFSKLQNIIYKDICEPLEAHGGPEAIKRLSGLRVLRQNLESFTKELVELFQKIKGEENQKKALERELDQLVIRISEFVIYLREISQKTLTFFFPSFEVGAYGLNSLNFVSGYDKLLTKFQRIEKELGSNKQDFNSIMSASFWFHNFKKCEEVGFEEFFEKFQLFSEQIDKIKLGPDDYVNIEKEIVNSEKMVEKKLWDEFYWRKWIVWGKRKELLKK